MVCLYLKLKKHFLAIFGYSFWKCVAKLATVSKILARAQVLSFWFIIKVIAVYNTNAINGYVVTFLYFFSDGFLQEDWGLPKFVGSRYPGDGFSLPVGEGESRYRSHQIYPRTQCRFTKLKLSMNILGGGGGILWFSRRHTAAAYTSSFLVTLTHEIHVSHVDRCM